MDAIAVAASLTATVSLVALLTMGFKLAAMIVRIHDNVMGDGNGRKPLRELIEHHMTDDTRRFTEVTTAIASVDEKTDVILRRIVRR